MEKVKSFVRKEAVFCIAALCAAGSAAFVPPSVEYLRYIDFRVLCLLFGLMAVVAGLQECGVFPALAQRLLEGKRSLRGLAAVLVMLPFWCSMLITNDVALITFVPFTILVLTLAGRRDRIIPVVVLQTAAANLGSMATPVGNPQNLFLYSRYSLSAGQFFGVLALPCAVSLTGLAGAALFCTPRQTVEVRFEGRETLRRPAMLVCFAGLFVMCLLSVFRVLHYGAAALLVLGGVLLFDRGLLRRVDWSLLATFVCFFIFAGNMGELEAVQGLLRVWMEKSAFFTSLLASQVISNVPAAVLLAGFTEDWQGLLLGVDIGGLGTPIASLASLISLKIYCAQEDAAPGRYLLSFLLVNLVGLVLLTAVSLPFCTGGGL